MGNIKEAVIPYFKKEIKLAKMSFDLYGAVSPSEETATNKKDDDATIANNEVKKERIVTQVELESSAPPVSLLEKFCLKFSSFLLLVVTDRVPKNWVTAYWFWKCREEMGFKAC